MSADEGDAPDATRGVEHRLLRLDRVAGRALRLWPLGGLRRGQTWVGELAVTAPSGCGSAVRIPGRLGRRFSTDGALELAVP